MTGVLTLACVRGRETIRDAIDAVLIELEHRLPDSETRSLVSELRTGFGEPLRVAVAGRIKAGKSTLVNALLGQRVAPTDVGECTRYVTWYKSGYPEHLEVVGRDGQRLRRSLRADGSVPHELDLNESDVHHLEVFLANDRLRRLTVIDTPGLASADDARSSATRELLAIDRDSRTAVSEADVLLLVLALDGRPADQEVLAAFESQFDGLRRTALNAVAVLSKIDLLGGPGEPLAARAEQVAEAISPKLRTPLAAVVPVATLLAETLECSLLGEEDTAALCTLAGTPLHDRQRLLRTVDRFVATDSPVPAGRRARLLERLDLHGVALALQEVDAGRASTSDLVRRLRAESGMEAFRTEVLDSVSRNADILKCARLLTTLARAGADDQTRRHILWALEQLWLEPPLHAVRLERAAQLHSSGEATIPASLARELHTMARGASGALPPTQLGAIAGAASRWRAFANSGRAGPAEREVAEAMYRTYELSYQQLAADKVAGTGDAGSPDG